MSEYDLRAPIEAILMVISEPVTPEDLAAALGTEVADVEATLRALAHEYLDGLEAAALDDVVDRAWDPPVTRASRLASIIDDAAQHSGQAVYTRRLLGLPG